MPAIAFKYSILAGSSRQCFSWRFVQLNPVVGPLPLHLMSRSLNPFKVCMF